MGRDRKFAIAVLIILVLVGVLVYVLVIGPRFQGYVVQKQLDAQQSLVKAMIQSANQVGYITLTDGKDSIVLVKYQQQEQANTQQIVPAA